MGGLWVGLPRPIQRTDAYKHVINPRVSMLAFSTQEEQWR